jgi:glyoxylase-like metal-dependent hydrolase (beta-lactamase superfamily II)
VFRIISFALLGCIASGIAANAQQDQPKIVKINGSIYMAPLGANIYLVTTPAGNVIDTGTSSEAANAREFLRAERHAPVRYLILTHGHPDHIGGISFWKEAGTQIIAQRNYVELVNYVARLEGFLAPRNAAAFNRPQEELRLWAGNSHLGCLNSRP